MSWLADRPWMDRSWMERTAARPAWALLSAPRHPAACCLCCLPAATAFGLRVTTVAVLSALAGVLSTAAEGRGEHGMVFTILPESGLSEFGQPFLAARGPAPRFHGDRVSLDALLVDSSHRNVEGCASGNAGGGSLVIRAEDPGGGELAVSNDKKGTLKTQFAGRAEGGSSRPLHGPGVPTGISGCGKGQPAGAAFVRLRQGVRQENRNRALEGGSEAPGPSPVAGRIAMPFTLRLEADLTSPRVGPARRGETSSRRVSTGLEV